MGKVPEYTNKAIEKYHAKFDRIAASLPKGYKQIIADNIGTSVNQYINQLVTDDLKRRGLLPGPGISVVDQDGDICPFD